jgi:two-component system, NarL family, sensor histidine kinase UhpB
MSRKSYTSENAAQGRRRPAQEVDPAGENRLRSLLLHVIEGQEKERRELARLLHTELGQCLALIRHSLGAAAELKISDSTPSCGEIVDRAAEFLHEITGRLRPPVLDDFGLSTALEWLASHVPVGAKFAASVKLAQERLAPDVETGVFRFVQHSVDYLYRQAGATKVNVVIRGDSDSLFLSLAHNATRAPANHWTKWRQAKGVCEVAPLERIELMGGTWKQCVANGCEVRLDVVLPLSRSSGVPEQKSLDPVRQPNCN